MRTFDADVQAAFDSGSFTPVIRAWRSEETVPVEQLELLYFKKNKITATIKYYTPTMLGLGDSIKLERGILLNGTEHTIFSMDYIPYRYTSEKNIITAECYPFSAARFSTPGDVTYASLLSTLCHYDQFLSPIYKNASAAWKNYQYYPDGKTILINRQWNIFSQLQQKYFIFAEDGDADNLLFFSAPDHLTTSEYTIPTYGEDIIGFRSEFRHLFWTDENETEHTSGSTFNQLHNLGYLESTASAPTIPAQGNTSLDSVFIVPVNLKYQSGDCVKFNIHNLGLTTWPYCLDVTEIFEPGAPMAWRMELRPIEFFSNTAGGALPSTIERVSNYTPLQTSGFNGLYNSSINNLQAMADITDDHTHGVEAPIAAPTAASDFLVGEQVSGIWKWVKKTLAETITILRTSLDSIYTAITGWIPVTDTWTYATTYSFTVPGNKTAALKRGTKILVTQPSGTKYLAIVSSSYSAPDTTVNVTGGGDYSLANEAITNPYYSNVDVPDGFPTTFAWTPTLGGFSVDPTGTYKFRIMPMGMYVDVQQSVAGTSNATTFSISAPPGVTFPASAIMGPLTFAFNNGAVVTTGINDVRSNAGGSQYDLALSGSTSTWTNANGKRCRFTMIHSLP